VEASHSNSHFHKTLNFIFFKGLFSPIFFLLCFFHKVVCVHKVMHVVLSNVFALVWNSNVLIIASKKILFFFSLYFTFLHLLFFFLLFPSIFFPHASLVLLPCCLACLVALSCYHASLPRFVPSSFHLVVLSPCCASCYFIASLPLLALLLCCIALFHCLAQLHCLATYCYPIAMLPHVASLPSCLVAWLSSCFVPPDTPPPNLLFHYFIASHLATLFALLPCTLCWLVLPSSFLFGKEELGRASS